MRIFIRLGLYSSGGTTTSRRTESEFLRVQSSSTLRILLVQSSSGFTRKVGIHALLCATSVCSVPLWFIIAQKNNHRDTEHTEVAQRRSRIETFRAKPSSSFSLFPDRQPKG